MHQSANLLAALIAGLLFAVQLSGCASVESLGDPYQRAGTWSSIGANDANLRAMVADPKDLALGRGDERTLAVEAVPPVGRLLTGHRLPLSTESASGIGAETQTQASTAPGGPNVGQ